MRDAEHAVRAGWTAAGNAPVRSTRRGIGRGTRWYWCIDHAVVDGHARLLALFRLARAYDCHIIVSSWEYQQSLSALESRTISDELFGVPPPERCLRMGDAPSQLVAFLKVHGLADRIAHAELHNEVDQSRLVEGHDQGTPTIVALKPLVEAAISPRTNRFQARRRRPRSPRFPRT